MAIEPMTLALAGIAIFLPVLAFAGSAALGGSATVHQLRSCGFEPDGDAWVHRRGGVVLTARISQVDTHDWLEILGPRLPVDAPVFRARTQVPAGSILSGDVDFDAAVAATHHDAATGLAWMSSEVRAAAREAVALPARVVDRRWRYRNVCTAESLAPIVDALARVSAAMEAGPSSTNVGLASLVRADPNPAVRVRALESLAARNAADQHVVDVVVRSAQPDLLLAAVRSGGPYSPDAWEALTRFGSRRQRAEGVVALACHVINGRIVRCEAGSLVPPLLDALTEPTQAHRVPPLLGQLNPPRLLQAIVDRFGTEVPQPLAPLLRDLREAARPNARGSVSLVDASSGGLALADDDAKQA